MVNCPPVLFDFQIYYFFHNHHTFLLIEIHNATDNILTQFSFLCINPVVYSGKIFKTNHKKVKKAPEKDDILLLHRDGK